jgi:O-antigen ligase
MNRDAVDKWCERGILALVLAILVYTPLAFGGQAQPPAGSWFDFLVVNSFLIVRGLTVGVMILWTIRLWFSPQPQFLWPPICWAVLAFSLYAVVRYFFSDIEYVARQEMIRVLVYAFLFFAILNNLHRQESIQLIAITLIFLAMGISFLALYQFLTGSDRVWHVINPYKHRAAGTYINPNHLGGFLEMLLPLGLAYTVISRAKPLIKVFVGYASLAIVAGIAVTVSRGGWLATVLALLLFCGVLVFRRTYRLPVLVLLVVLIGAGAYFIPRTHVFQARLKQVFAHGKLDDDVRFDLWVPATEMWRDNKWWGVGPGHFNYRFAQHRPQNVQLQPNRVHNDYLNTLVDWGIAGLVLVASAWLLLLAGIAKAWSFVRGTPNDLGKQSSNKFAFVLGAALGLFAMLVHATVEFNMHTPANALVAVALMALLSTHLRFATEKYWKSARLWMLLVASLFLGAGILYLGYQEWRGARECVWLTRAARLPDFSDKRIAALEKAFAAEPKNFETASAIGDIRQKQSAAGAQNSDALARQAMEWFQRSMKLNPFDGRPFINYALCLGWLERAQEAAPFVEKAMELDPNNYFILNGVGLHYVNLGNYAGARAFFERSRRLQWKNNPIADSYLGIVNERMLESATNNAADLRRFLYKIGDSSPP